MIETFKITMVKYKNSFSECRSIPEVFADTSILFMIFLDLIINEII